MTGTFNASEMWARIISETQLDPSLDLDENRIREINKHLAGWDPAANGVRYAKTALYLAAQRLESRHWALLDAIGETRLRDPVEVILGSRSIGFDYLQVVLELDFMAPALDKANTVTEIGAGYGRTAHGVLITRPNLHRYTIIDLAPCLALSRSYLRRVLPQEFFTKIAFVANDELGDGAVIGGDLVINIDSMAEMDAEIVRGYLCLIDRYATTFYCKNPVGKYMPQSIGLPESAIGSVATSQAMKTGLLRDIVDIFNELDIEGRSDAFAAAYRPSPDWGLINASPALPWTYYRQALFGRV
ncbi:conserved hypothetical protein [Candidatus Terasakiella magnetica]|nr:conserved hypothetical protein [Candidatus Terasakiella magnetica]